jgi:hypothetical protein
MWIRLLSSINRCSLLLSDFAMSNEIKDNDDVHANMNAECVEEIIDGQTSLVISETHVEDKQEEIEVLPSVTIDDSRSESTASIALIDDKANQQEEARDDQMIFALLANEKQVDTVISSASIDNKHDDTESADILPTNDDTPAVTVHADVNEEKETEPVSLSSSEKHVLVASTVQQSAIPIVRVQSDESSSIPVDDSHRLLHIIANKSNRDASTTILNTVRKHNQ